MEKGEFWLGFVICVLIAAGFVFTVAAISYETNRAVKIYEANQ